MRRGTVHWSGKPWTITETVAQWIAGGRRYVRVHAEDPEGTPAVFDLVKLDEGWRMAGLEVIRRPD